jgi:hypothetical protein
MSLSLGIGLGLTHTRPHASQQNRRVYYDTVPGGEPFGRVLLTHPRGEGPVSVYVPPIKGERAWTQTVANLEQAIALAETLDGPPPQKTMLLTRDSYPWWLEGLVAVSDTPAE